MYTPSSSFLPTSPIAQPRLNWWVQYLAHGLEVLLALLNGFFSPGKLVGHPGISVWSNRLLLVYAIPLFFIFGAMALPILVVYQLFFHLLIVLAFSIA